MTEPTPLRQTHLERLVAASDLQTTLTAQVMMLDSMPLIVYAYRVMNHQTGADLTFLSQRSDLTTAMVLAQLLADYNDFEFPEWIDDLSGNEQDIGRTISLEREEALQSLLGAKLDVFLGAYEADTGAMMPYQR